MRCTPRSGVLAVARGREPDGSIMMTMSEIGGPGARAWRSRHLRVRSRVAGNPTISDRAHDHGANACARRRPTTRKLL